MWRCSALAQIVWTLRSGSLQRNNAITPLQVYFMKQVLLHISALQLSPQKSTAYLITARRAEQKLNCIRFPLDPQCRAPAGIKSLCLTAGKNKTPSAVGWYFLFMCQRFSPFRWWLDIQIKKSPLTSGPDQGRVHILPSLTDWGPF